MANGLERPALSGVCNTALAQSESHQQIPEHDNESAEDDKKHRHCQNVCAGITQMGDENYCRKITH